MGRGTDARTVEGAEDFETVRKGLRITKKKARTHGRLSFAYLGRGLVFAAGLLTLRTGL